jgi:hypothetical protein
LNPDEVLLEFKAMVDCAFRVGKDGERRFERLGVPASTLQRVTKDYQNLRPGLSKLIVHAPQLGDMRAALQSVVLPHEKQDHFLAAIIGERNLTASG